LRLPLVSDAISVSRFVGAALISKSKSFTRGVHVAATLLAGFMSRTNSSPQNRFEAKEEKTGGNCVLSIAGGQTQEMNNNNLFAVPGC
jgi:hypothetical protein